MFVTREEIADPAFELSSDREVHLVVFAVRIRDRPGLELRPERRRKRNNSVFRGEDYSVIRRGG